MAAPTVWYFAYGSNMSRAQMQQRVGHVLDAQPARLENYEMVFNKKVRGGSGEANIQRAKGKTVHGVLYRVTGAALRTLDRATGVPEHYRRIEVKVTDMNGRGVAAQVYIAAKVEKGLRPAPHYLQTLLDGAGEQGLPADYIAGIKTAAGQTS